VEEAMRLQALGLFLFVLLNLILIGMGIRAVINNWPVVAEYKVNQ
jgi:hypothetical protein